jgi:hypothetical protein
MAGADHCAARFCDGASRSKKSQEQREPVAKDREYQMLLVAIELGSR